MEFIRLGGGLGISREVYLACSPPFIPCTHFKVALPSHTALSLSFSPLYHLSCRSLASEPRSLHFVLHLFAGGFLGQHGQREFDLGAYRASGGCKREPFFHSLLPRVV